MDEADWDAVLAVNLKGAFLMSKAVLRGMIKRRRGSIVSISSVVGRRGNSGQANYSAAKAGLLGFTKSLAREVASRNVRVNAVAPGYIETEMTARLARDCAQSAASIRSRWVASVHRRRSRTRLPSLPATRLLS